MCTQTGKPARLICYDADDKDYPIVALVYINNREVAWHFANDGKCGVNEKENLMMAPYKYEGWINIYKLDTGDREVCDTIYDTQHEAMLMGKVHKESYITTIKIEWEE